MSRSIAEPTESLGSLPSLPPSLPSRTSRGSRLGVPGSLPPSLPLPAELEKASATSAEGSSSSSMISTYLREEGAGAEARREARRGSEQGSRAGPRTVTAPPWRAAAHPSMTDSRERLEPT